MLMLIKIFECLDSEATKHTTSASVSSKRTIEEDEDNGQDAKRVKLETSEDNSAKGLTYMGNHLEYYYFKLTIVQVNQLSEIRALSKRELQLTGCVCMCARAWVCGWV